MIEFSTGPSPNQQTQAAAAISARGGNTLTTGRNTMIEKSNQGGQKRLKKNIIKQRAAKNT